MAKVNYGQLGDDCGKVAHLRWLPPRENRDKLCIFVNNLPPLCDNKAEPIKLMPPDWYQSVADDDGNWRVSEFSNGLMRPRHTQVCHSELRRKPSAAETNHNTAFAMNINHSRSCAFEEFLRTVQRRVSSFRLCN